MANISNVLKKILSRKLEKDTPFQNWLIGVSSSKDEIEIKHIGRKVDLVASLYVDDSFVGSYRFETGKISINLSGSNTKRVINEIRISSPSEKGCFNYILQLAKESPEYLKNTYNFTHNTGYLVIERNTIPFKEIKSQYSNICNVNVLDSGDEKKEILSMLCEYDSNALEILQQEAMCIDDAVKKSCLLTKFLWDFFSVTGPSDKVTSSMSTYQILSIIKNDGGTVQCTGTRDLFINLARISSSGLKIRKLDLYRYYPFIENIVVNGHSVIEIKFEDQWFLFDPFVRVFFKDLRTNKFLASSDIKSRLHEEQLDLITPVHVETKHASRTDFDDEEYLYDSCSWNYFSHFNKCVYTNLRYTNS